MRRLLAAVALLSALAAPARADESPAQVFRWDKVAGASAYIIEIAEDKSFARIVVREKVRANLFRWTRLSHRAYYWRVKAVEADGREGDFSRPRRVAPAISPPALMAPAKDARIPFADKSPSVVLEWKKSRLLREYVVEIARDSRFSRGRETHKLEGSRFAYQAKELGRFYWRVGGTDVSGQQVAPSPPRAFEVVPAPPNPSAPTAGARVPWDSDRLRVTLRWRSRPVASYELQIGRDRTLRRKPVTLTSTKPAAEFRPRKVGTYYWRVRGREPDSAWSKVRAFEVVLATPQPIAPESGAVVRLRGDTGSMELSWHAVPKAVAYIVELHRDDEPADARAPPVRTDATSATFETLAARSYQWTVRAVDRSGAESAPSQVRAFQLTSHAKPRRPILASPEPGAEIELAKATPLDFRWQPVKGARAYDLEVSRSKELADPLVERTVTEPRVTLEVPRGERLYWRVRAIGEADVKGDWSEPAAFAYRVSPPAVTKRVPARTPTATATAPPPAAVVRVAPRLGLFMRPSEMTTPTLGLEVDVRPKRWRRLRVALSAGYFTTSATATDADTTVMADSRLHAVPIELALFLTFEHRVASFYVGGGPQLSIVYATVSTPTQPRLGKRSIELGGVGIGGAERRAGPGAVFAQLDYALTTKVDTLVEMNPGGMKALVGYRFGVW